MWEDFIFFPKTINTPSQTSANACRDHKMVTGDIHKI